MIKKHRQHKSGIIAAALREQCLQPDLPSGALLPSTHQVAANFQVSLMTAHQALQQLKLEGLVYRVQGSGTYLKKSISLPKRIGIADCSIAMLYNEEMQQAQNRVISNCIEYLTEHCFDVQTISYPELSNATTAAKLLASLDGLLLSYNYADSDIIAKLANATIPIVVYRHEFVANLPFSQVVFDFNPGILQALSSLALAPDDSPIIIYESTPSALHRRDLLTTHLQAAGFPPEKLIFQEVCSVSRTADCFRLARVSSRRWRGKLLFCVIDDIAAGIINALKAEQLYPGKDYRLLSIGNSENYGFRLFETPFLASIDMPLQQLAQESCRLLTSLIEEPGISQHIIRIPGYFVKRPSAFLDKNIVPVWAVNSVLGKKQQNSKLKPDQERVKPDPILQTEPA
ncbi:MAG: GntR family transcriptional regulator [Lentisphaeria bacterium]